MLTKNGKILVGNEIKNWLDSLLPSKEVSNWGFGGGCSMTTLEGEENDTDIFSIESYGQSLQPAMTRELEEKISRDVSKGVAYSDQAI
jgi:tRNA G46 methylase TrmB